MNAAFLLMSSAALAGADVAPPPVHTHPPVVINGGGGCTNCGTPAPAPSSCGCEKTKIGLFDKLKSKFGGFGKKSSHDCGCVPACAPVPVPLPAPAACNTCNSCPTSVASRPNLFDKLKSRCGHKKAETCGPVCDSCGAAHLPQAGCATPGTPYTPPTTTTPPKEMPKEMPKDPKDKPKDKPKDPPKGGAVIPLPLPPVTGAGLTGSTSPY